MPVKATQSVLPSESTVKVAKQAYFGEMVMAQCTIAGSLSQSGEMLQRLLGRHTRDLEHYKDETVNFTHPHVQLLLPYYIIFDVIT